jgi:hypothetical protein
VKILSLINDLCSVGLINPTGVVVGVQRQRLAPSVGPPEKFPP